MTSNFLIGPIKDGLRKDIKPWAIPEDAFETLTNAYQWLGRLVRRQGYTLLGRLANNTPVMGLRTRELFGVGLQELIAFDTTQAYQYDTLLNIFVNLFSVMTVLWSGADFNFFYSINYAGAFWATNNIPGLHGWNVTNFSGSAGVGLAATTNVGAPGNAVAIGDIVYFFNLDGTPQNNLIFARVTSTGATFKVIAISFPKGVNSFTDGVNTRGMVMDSFKTVSGQDGIRYYAQTLFGLTWVNYNPPLDPNNALAGALLIFSYRGYLVFLNTWEGNDQGISQFGQRARWTQIGTPYYSNPVPSTPDLQTFDPLTARDDLFGRGGANDAPTQEVIVGAEFIRDILIVYFERSTWRLRFVNNSQNPFVWERVNIELGADSTFSTIPFDKGLMAIGTRGIVISDGNDTIRFDEKIPLEIFNVRQANNGLSRIHGIRSFRTKLNFWTIPSNENPTGIYPDQVLVFNYDTKNWSFFDDCFTCFGYFYNNELGYRWQDLTNPWPDYDDLNCSTGVTQRGFETILAGNQQGFVFKLEQSSAQNDPSLYITAITISTGTTPTIITSLNHNLPDGTWIKLTNIAGVTYSDGVSLNGRNFKISLIDKDNFSLNEFEAQQGPDTDLVGLVYNYTIDFIPILPGSVQINVSTLQFVDGNNDGNLQCSDLTSTGTINYNTGQIVLNFSAPVISMPVFIRVVSYFAGQQIDPIQTIGAYVGTAGLITKISGIDIQSKIFNFFGQDQRARLSKIDFYTALTANGQFTCNVFADSSNVAVNVPLFYNRQRNVVLTTINPYQVSQGNETIYRLFCDALAQTVQLQLTLSDQQMAVTAVNDENIEILAMMISMRPGGRLV